MSSISAGSGSNNANNNVLARASCDPSTWPAHGWPLQADTDIAGKGVIIAFLASAYMTIILAIIAYFTGMIPEHLLNVVDRRVFRVKAISYYGPRYEWARTIDKVVLILADQQLITGIGILVAAFAQWRTITVYHWQIVIYLSWMSSSTHLTTLTLLRRTLQASSFLRSVRLAGMTLLAIMLIIALVPTIGMSWQATSDGSAQYQLASPGNPARCYWHKSVNPGARSDPIVSVMIIIVSYIWRLAYLYKSGETFLTDWLIEKPLGWIGMAITWSNKPNRPKKGQSKPRKRQNLLSMHLVALYAWYLAFVEFIQSFSASICFIIIIICWGSLELFSTRARAWQASHDDCIAGDLSSETGWNFGQILPLMLLILPLMGLAEQVNDLHHDYDPRNPHNRRQLLQAENKKSGQDQPLDNLASSSSNRDLPSLKSPAPSITKSSTGDSIRVLNKVKPPKERIPKFTVLLAESPFAPPPTHQPQSPSPSEIQLRFSRTNTSQSIELPQYNVRSQTQRTDDSCTQFEPPSYTNTDDTTTESLSRPHVPLFKRPADEIKDIFRQSRHVQILWVSLFFLLAAVVACVLVWGINWNMGTGKNTLNAIKNCSDVQPFASDLAIATFSYSIYFNVWFWAVFPLLGAIVVMIVESYIGMFTSHLFR